MTETDSIGGCGYPLGFAVHAGSDRPAVLGVGGGSSIYTVEARKFSGGGHQKEAVVSEGADGAVWRLSSDEGRHLKGTDLAPFPLGFFNAGLHADLAGRIVALARERSIEIGRLGIDLRNSYWMTGSFFKGDGEGFAEPAIADVSLESAAVSDAVAELVADAALASPALAAMRTALTNTFAIYVNGRRREVRTMVASTAPDAADPYVTYAEPPSPAGETLPDLITKTGTEQEGDVAPAPAGTTSRIIRIIKGLSSLVDAGGATETETWLELPGMSHFALKSDENRDRAGAPSGLALLSAGIVFCFMTQLDRYIEHMKFNISGVRIVQTSPYSTALRDGRLVGAAAPVDTHLFLNGQEDDETYETLMRIAARTCYLHATLAAALEPEVRVTLNGDRLA